MHTNMLKNNEIKYDKKGREKIKDTNLTILLRKKSFFFSKS